LVVPRLIRDREACETVREETMGGIAREGGLETWASAFLTRKAYYEIFTRRGRIRAEHDGDFGQFFDPYYQLEVIPALNLAIGRDEA